MNSTMPIWVFAVSIVVFAVTVLWERYEYNKLRDDYETVGHFLDMYITKYGPLPGIIEIPEEDRDATISK